MEKEKVREIYQGIYKEYNEIAKNANHKSQDLIYEMVIKEIKSKSSPKKVSVLDIGCGTGLSSTPFLKKGFKVTGIDLSDNMLSIAKELPFEELRVYDVESPFNLNKKYDVIIMVSATEFITNFKGLFDNVKRHLTKEGIFALTIPKKPKTSKTLPFSMLTKRECEKIFDENNFSVIQYKESFGWHNKKSKVYNKPVNYYVYLLKGSFL